MGITERKACDNMRAIDADAVPQEFWEYEFDGKWRGCTIKDLLDSQPTIQPDNNLQKLADEIASFKRCVKSENSDYLTGYLCALSVVEGMIADMRGKQDG